MVRKDDGGGTPVRAHLVASGILTATVMLNFNKSMIDLFIFLALLGTITSLVAYLFTALAALRLQQTRTVEPSKMLIGIAIFAALYAVLSVIGAGTAPMMWGAVFFLSALVLYLAMRWIAHARPGVPVGDALHERR